MNNTDSTPTTRLTEISEDMTKDLYHLMDDEDNDSPLLDNCQYIEPDEIDNLSAKHAKLKVLHLNIHSLPDKIHQLQNLVTILKDKSYELDLILICETFITPLNINRCKLSNYTLVENHRVNKKWGGVAIFVNNRLKFKLREDITIFDEGKFESIFIEVMSDKRNIIVAELYRVPNTNEQSFFTKYQDIINKIDSEHKDIIIGTDQNLDFLKYAEHQNTANFLNLNLDSGLLPTIVKPTRITHSTATLIDNIYVRSRQVFQSKAAILTTDISDHLPCLLLIDCECKQSKESIKFQHRKLDDTALMNIKTDIGNTDWSELNQLDSNDGYNLLVTKITESLNKYAPQKETKLPSKLAIQEPWMTRGLLKSSIKCDRMYKSVIGISKDSEKYLRYKTYRNQYNYIKRRAKIEYYNKKVSEYTSDSRKLWQTLNKLIGRVKDKTSLTDSFLVNGQLITDQHHISNAFCDYFTNIGKLLAEKIPSPDKSFDGYLSGNTRNSLFFTPTDEDEIIKLISGLKSKKSYGYDTITSCLLKAISVEITPPLTVIINQSLTQGIVPDNMKIAKVVPVYKAKEKNLLSNYRPISILPSLSKLLEKVVHKRLYNFIKEKLYKSQYGFRSSHSTINAITEFIADVLEGFDQKEMTLGVFLDLSKAFDTIDHTILLYKLEHYGIRGIALQWFKSYLSQRQQYVQYKNYTSDTQLIECGVPQGSVLGPLLFIIYINDICNCLLKCKSILFADDSSVRLKGKNKAKLYKAMKEELTKLIEWFQANRLSLNLTKTYCVLFQPKKKKDEATADETNDDTPVLSIGNQIITQQKSVKFLGLLIDEHLDWSEQFTHLHGKLGRANYMLNTVKNILPAATMKLLYNSLFYSHLLYGIVVWGPSMRMAHIDKLEKCQKKAIRTISRANYNAPTNNLFIESNLLKLKDVIDLEMLKCMYLAYRYLLPEPIINIFNRDRVQHQYNTRRRNDPVIRQRNYAALDKSLLCKGPSLWTNLHKELKSSITVKSFSNGIKKSKLRLY